MVQVKVLFDNIGSLTCGDFDDHILLVKEVIALLHDNGFTIKSGKCEWGMQLCEYF